jgi:hypothetical protein
MPRDNNQKLKLQKSKLRNPALSDVIWSFSALLQFLRWVGHFAWDIKANYKIFGVEL